MKKIAFKGIKVKVFFDPMEYANMPEKPFGDIPKGAIFSGISDGKKQSYSTGFTTIDDRIIRIVVLKDCPFLDLFSTVSHELGHLIEGGFRKNPPNKNRYFNRHEKKANHYEQFCVKAYTLTSKIFALKEKNEKKER
jgi:hypothetical protein